MVPRGGRKPISRYQVERKEGRSVTIAHLTEPIARQDLADAPLLTAFVDSELRLGLETALEDEIINGDGTGDHFTGLNHVSGTQVQPWSTDLLTTTRQAVRRRENRASRLETAGPADRRVPQFLGGHLIVVRGYPDSASSRRNAPGRRAGGTRRG